MGLNEGLVASDLNEVLALHWAQDFEGLYELRRQVWVRETPHLYLIQSAWCSKPRLPILKWHEDGI